MDINENYDDPMMKKLPLEKGFQVIQECEIPMGCVGHCLVALEIGNARISHHHIAHFRPLDIIHCLRS